MKNWIGIAVLAGVMTTGVALSAQAADDYKKFGVRFRAVYVAPEEKFDAALRPLEPSLTDNVIPELDLEYFFTKNISSELILGVTRHDVKLGGDVAGSTYGLPPTLTVKYHPLAGATVSPYVGVGVNVLIPFASHMNNTPDFKVDKSMGWAAQLGADFKLTDALYFNVDYKYLNAETKVRIAGTKYNLDLNPHLVGVGVGYRF